MAQKITASSLFSRSFLVMKRDGFKFYQNGMFWGARRFRFAEVCGLLISADHHLAFQVGKEVFSIQTKPGNPKHEAVIAALRDGLEKSRAQSGSAVRYSSP